MKKVIALVVVLCVLTCGCGISAAEKNYSEQKETTVDSLIDEYRNIPNGGILDVDHGDLLELNKRMCETRYRVCGVLTEVEEKVSFGFPMCSAYLVSGSEKIYILFADNQEPIEGEYVEVVGKMDCPDKYLSSLSDCTITERGSSVRERLESSK